MSFAILIIAGLIVPLTYKKNILIGKVIATVAYLLAGFFIFNGNDLSQFFNYFATNSDIALIEYVVLITLIAVSLTLTGFERPMLAQMLFIGGLSLAILETNNMFIFIVLFEAIAIVSYVLAANIRNYYNAEGAIKTFIAGAVAGGVILLGFAIFALVTKSFDYSSMAVDSKYALVAAAIMLAGIFYKLTIVPMHGWASDAYSQINHAAAAILSGLIKSVILVAVFNAFAPFLKAFPSVSVIIFSFFAIVTMTLANFMALWQKRVSKVLAYSSIAHSGYALVPFAAIASKYAYSGVLYYAVAYIFMQTSVFLILNNLRKDLGIKYLEDLKGLGKRSGVYAFFFSVQLFSLAGIPLLAGFLSKAVAFYAGVDAGLWPLVLVALLNSALAVAYYAWIIKQIYFDAPVDENYKVADISTSSLIGQFILLAGTVYFGIVAGQIFQAAM
jgi:NADH-quinone oxidoreductase subunit N